MIGELLKILEEVIPHLLPDEAAKVQAKIEKLEKERDEKRKLALEGLNKGDINALNILLSEILE